MSYTPVQIKWPQPKAKFPGWKLLFRFAWAMATNKAEREQFRKVWRGQ